jgi:hypothetical protein
MMPRARRLRALLVIDLLALLFALSFATVSSPGPAERILARSVAILAEVDTYVDGNFAAIQQQADQTQEPLVTLPDFPLAVSFLPAEVQQSSRDQFRSLLLERSAALLHEDGAAAFRQGRPAQGGYLSPEGALRAAIDLLRPAPHGLFLGFTIALGMAAALLGLAISPAARDWLQTVGRSALLASVLFVAFAAVARASFWFAASAADDDFARAFLTLAEQLTWVPIRDGLIVMVAGAALALAGSVLQPEGPQRA